MPLNTLSFSKTAHLQPPPKMQLSSVENWRDLNACLLILVSILAIPALAYLVTSILAHHTISRHMYRGNNAIYPPTVTFAIPILSILHKRAQVRNRISVPPSDPAPSSELLTLIYESN